jgi:hypothetical protein
VKGIGPDKAACEALDRHAALVNMVHFETWVEVTGPTGARWQGRIIGLADHPTVLIETGSGLRLALPQAYAVRPVPDPEQR